MLKMTTFKNLTVLAATAAFAAAGYKASAQDDLDDLLNDLAGSGTVVEKKAEEPAKPAEPAVATPAPVPSGNASADTLLDDAAPAPAQAATDAPVAEAKAVAPAPEAVAADAEPKADESAKLALSACWDSLKVFEEEACSLLSANDEIRSVSNYLNRVLFPFASLKACECECFLITYNYIVYITVI